MLAGKATERPGNDWRRRRFLMRVENGPQSLADDSQLADSSKRLEGYRDGSCEHPNVSLPDPVTIAGHRAQLPDRFHHYIFCNIKHVCGRQDGLPCPSEEGAHSKNYVAQRG